MDKIVIYDTETTNSTIWGSIIEVGAVVVDKNLKKLENSILEAECLRERCQVQRRYLLIQQVLIY